MKWKKRTIRSYHLESDIFNQKPSNDNMVKVKNYNNSDIFHLKGKDMGTKKTIKTAKYLMESEKEEDKKPSKQFHSELYAETEQKNWNTNRMRPEKRKEDPNNTLAFDLTNQPIKFLKTEKKIIKDPHPKKDIKNGKKIFKKKKNDLHEQE